MNIRHNAYTENLGTDWVALDAGLTPIARSTDEASLRRAVPNAAHYLSGEQVADAAEAMAKTLRAAAKPQLDHDKNGKAGGAKKPVEAPKQEEPAAEPEEVGALTAETPITASIVEEMADLDKLQNPDGVALRSVPHPEGAGEVPDDISPAALVNFEQPAEEEEPAAKEAPRRPGGPSPASRQRKPAAK